jgi:N-methylhydantoinase A
VADPTDVEGAVAEFHRINAEARLIEARAQEPVLRGIRLTAVGEVERLAEAELPTATAIEPIAQRRMWIGDSWREGAPIYEMRDMLAGVTVIGPAAIRSPFTTVILGPDERARVTPFGDMLIDLPAAAQA